MNVGILSATLRGVESTVVEIEVQVRSGLARTTMIGLPDNVIRESRERIRAAVAHAGFRLPRTHVIINLAPAETPKSGPCFDLPLALGLVATQHDLELQALSRTLAFGELRLDGRVQAVGGAVSLALAAKHAPVDRLILPRSQASLAATVVEKPCYGVDSLIEAVQFCRGELPLQPAHALPTPAPEEPRVRLSDVRGLFQAKRALRVAAAGAYNLLFVGPPGSGKSMLARRLPGLLPQPTREEAIAITRIASLRDPGLRTLVRHRPFRAPHHTSSTVSITGGSFGKAGELTLAHLGVLFLDELPEFRRDVLEAMRQPLEDGRLTVGRARQTLTLPCEVQLVAAMNPCPCGYFGHPTRSCRCSDGQRRAYVGRISGPLLDRFDLVLRVDPVEPGEAFQQRAIDEDHTTREAVQLAFDRGRTRRHERPNVALLDRDPAVSNEARDLLVDQVRLRGGGTRLLTKTLRIAWTLADLDERDTVLEQHVAEAFALRQEDVLFEDPAPTSMRRFP